MRLRAVANRMRREESGVVLVLAAVCMTFILGFAAIAIDVGSWYQTQRQAQAAADAGALAAVVVSSSQASTTASTWVAKNMSGATTNVSFPASNQVKVTVTTTASIFFGSIFGIGPPTVSASAIAQKSSGQQSCSGPGNTCYAIFAKDQSCTGDPIVLGGGTTINGAMWSNGSINLGGGGSTFGGTVTYGNGPLCTVRPSNYQQQGNTFSGGLPSQQTPQASWPLDYSLDFAPCSASSCTGPLGTPSWCTQANTTGTSSNPWYLHTYNPSNLSNGNIYCAVGPTGTPSDPTTWNGAIKVAGGPVIASFVANTIVVGGGSTVTACGYVASGYNSSTCSAGGPAPATTNYPMFYAVGTGTAIDTSSGGDHFTGDMFAPNGTISVGGGTSTMFLEGFDIYAPGGGWTGDGPTSSSGGGSSGSTGASLVG